MDLKFINNRRVIAIHEIEKIIMKDFQKTIKFENVKHWTALRSLNLKALSALYGGVFKFAITPTVSVYQQLLWGEVLKYHKLIKCQISPKRLRMEAIIYGYFYVPNAA